ncbi:hypothetical protein E2562_036544 [Oryza meyeriana var. granulata]|uniref:Uncharacterized protein n=1 Tax=Oryza meyeriana var. granulata TaxID=110450 RepID=A0A6G1DRP2_9ORYZ|nr:hypothetical protein E2562_036544 [Oryza meyeriana var. granulata]
MQECDWRGKVMRGWIQAPHQFWLCGSTQGCGGLVGEASGDGDDRIWCPLARFGLPLSRSSGNDDRHGVVVASMMENGGRGNVDGPMVTQLWARDASAGGDGCGGYLHGGCWGLLNVGELAGREQRLEPATLCQ